MKQGYDGLINNNVWELVKCPVNRSPIGSKWVLKTKYNEDLPKDFPKGNPRNLLHAHK